MTTRFGRTGWIDKRDEADVGAARMEGQGYRQERAKGGPEGDDEWMSASGNKSVNCAITTRSPLCPGWPSGS
jgi:hypothetical protein